MPKTYASMKVYINDLSFKAIIGILPFERKTPQKVVINLTFRYNYDKNNADFVDYSQVTSVVKKIIKQKKFLLIEDAILTLKDTLLYKFHIYKLKIKISKPTILKDCIVSVGI